MIFMMATCGSLSAKEIFDFAFPAITDFDYSTVKTASFFFPGNKEIDVDRMIKSLAKGKADVVVTGKTSIEGEALSPGLTTFIIVQENREERSWLVTINSYVSGVARKSITTDGEQLQGNITIASRSLVFDQNTQPKELERAISLHLRALIDKITSASKAKPKFFIVD
jgi:hypothetical protein